MAKITATRIRSGRMPAPTTVVSEVLDRGEADEDLEGADGDDHAPECAGDHRRQHDDAPGDVPVPQDRPEQCHDEQRQAEVALHGGSGGSEEEPGADGGGARQPDKAETVRAPSTGRLTCTRCAVAGERLGDGVDRGHRGEGLVGRRRGAEPAPAGSRNRRDHLQGAQGEQPCAEGVDHPPPHGRSGTGPGPPEEKDAQRGRRLHPGRGGAEDDAGNRAPSLGHRQASEEEAEHERLVVRPPDERGQDEGTPGAEEHGAGGISAPPAGQGGRGRHDECETGHLQEPQQHDVGQDLMARCVVQQPVDRQERRTVGRRGIGPDGIGHGAERRRPEHAGSVDIGVDVVADHLSLPGVAVHVPAEQRRCQQEGQGPDDNDHHHSSHGDAVVR